MDDEKLKKLLADSRTTIAPIELTPELKQHLQEVCNEVTDVLTKRTRGPAEAIMVLHFLTETLSEMMHLKGVKVIEGYDI